MENLVFAVVVMTYEVLVDNVILYTLMLSIWIILVSLLIYFLFPHISSFLPNIHLLSRLLNFRFLYVMTEDVSE